MHVGIASGSVRRLTTKFVLVRDVSPIETKRDRISDARQSLLSVFDAKMLCPVHQCIHPFITNSPTAHISINPSNRCRASARLWWP